MKKQMITMLVIVGVIFGLIFGWKGFVSIMIQRYIANMKAPVVSVSTMKVEPSLWQPVLRSVGSLRASVGVNITPELPGMIESIYFTPGAAVKKGDILVQLNARSELGQLHSLQAQVELAKITFQRDKAQYLAHAVSKQVVDTDEWNLKNLQAQVEQQTAIVDKKTLRAPFAGQLGINNVNPGQYLGLGDIVTILQVLDPIYVDFYLPQQDLAELKTGQDVVVVVDTYPKEKFKGIISTIQPAVDSSTRNVEVEATLPNSAMKLKPGMFAKVDIDIKTRRNYLTVPQSAISFNAYGDVIYRVKETGEKDENNQPVLIAEQAFVKLGDTRGDQVAVLHGLKAGDMIVTSGQLKLKNGSHVTINNKVTPNNEAFPQGLEKK